MPAGLGGNDANGVYKYGEADPTGPLFSDFLNLLASSVSTVITALKARLTTLEAGSDTAWTNLTLINSWVTSAGLTPQVRRWRGSVYFRGRISGGTGAPFVLPALFRPGQDCRFSVPDGSTGIAICVVSITTAGVVAVTASSVPNLASIAPFIQEN